MVDHTYPKILSFQLEPRAVDAVYLDPPRGRRYKTRGIVPMQVLGWALVEEADGSTHVEGLVAARENAGTGAITLAGNLPGLYEYFVGSALENPAIWKDAQYSTHRLMRRRRPRERAQSRKTKKTDEWKQELRTTQTPDV